MSNQNETTNHTPAPRSEAQKEAARRNGAKSRGPITLMGKSISSRNALRHGLTSFDLALSSENQDHFDMVLADFMSELQPQGVLETTLVEELAYAKWRQYRAWKTETAIYNIEIDANREKVEERFKSLEDAVRTADALESSLARTSSLPHLHRCETRVNRQYNRALQNLINLRQQANPTQDFAETNPGISLITNENAPQNPAEPDAA